MENTTIENVEDVIEDINEETLLSLDENLELDQEVAEIIEAKCKKEGEDEEESESDEEESCDSDEEDDEESEEMTEGKIKEAEVNSDEEFTEYAQGVLKSAHGENYDDKKAAETIEGILKKADGDYGAAVGMLTSGLGEEITEAISLKYYATNYSPDSFSRSKWSKIEKMDDWAKEMWADADYDTEYHPAKKYFRNGDEGATVTVGASIEEVKRQMAEYDAWIKKVWAKNEEVEITIDSSDITRLVESEQGLTEEFKEKATTIFEAAIKSKLKETEETLKESYAATLIEEVEAIKEELVDKIDSYLTYAVESWAADNAVAIESGLRTEIAENFIQSLKTVFVENYIEVPEAKKDLVAEMEEQVATLQAEAETTSETLAALNERVERLTCEKIVAEACADLVDTQAAKLQSLVEDISFTTEDAYRKKVDTIKEFYLKGVLGEEQTETLQESNEDSYVTTETIVENDSLQEESVSPAMQKYLTALSRLNKANEATVPVRG